MRIIKKYILRKGQELKTKDLIVDEEATSKRKNYIHFINHEFMHTNKIGYHVNVNSCGDLVYYDDRNLTIYEVMAKMVYTIEFCERNLRESYENDMKEWSRKFSHIVDTSDVGEINKHLFDHKIVDGKIILKDREV